MHDLQRWSFPELRKILGCPGAIDFRLGYEFAEGKEGLRRVEHLIAVGRGEVPTAVATVPPAADPAQGPERKE